MPGIEPSPPARRSATAGLLLLAMPAEAKGPAGRYRLVGEQDVASDLLILTDGRFRYALAAGAFDERAEGIWKREGDMLFLTTAPRPVPPAFVAGGAKRSEAAALTLRVSRIGGRGLAGVDVRIGFAEGGTADGYTQEDGWSLPREERRTPPWVQLSIPMFGLASPRYPVDIAKANDLSFELIPNDIGVADFRDLPVEVGKGRLVMLRYGGRLVYQRLKK